MIMPVFDYCDVVLGGIAQKHAYKLQKLQNSACRILLHRGPRSSATQMHAELKLDALDVRRDKHILNHVYKGVNGLFPLHISSRLELKKHDSLYATRSAGTMELRVPRVKLKVCEQNVFHYESILWNRIDDEIRMAPSYERFQATSTKEFP